MIKAIIFDFGNVICSFDMKKFTNRMADLTGLSVPRLAEVAANATQLAVDYETGLITSDDFFRRVVTDNGLAVTKPDFIDAFTRLFTPIASTFDLIRTVKPRYKLGLLSNTNEWHYEYGIKPVEVFPLFDSVTLSFEVKAMKPAEKIYRDALSKLQVLPGEAVYIDDLRENADAATALGMVGIHYTGHPALLRDLAGLHLTI